MVSILKKLPVISSIEYEQVVGKVGLSELLTSIERRNDTFLKVRLAPEFAVKEIASSKKPQFMVICNALNV